MSKLTGGRVIRPRACCVRIVYCFRIHRWRLLCESKWPHKHLPNPIDIQHSTFNIQHSTFNIQHSTSNIQHSTFNIQHPTFNIHTSYSFTQKQTNNPTRLTMHLYLTLLLLPPLSLHISSTSATVTVTETAAAACFTPTGPEYYLQSRVLNGGNSSKNGLYVEGYHTGAGENDAVLVPNTTDYSLAVGFLDGSYQARALSFQIT